MISLIGLTILLNFVLVNGLRIGTKPLTYNGLLRKETLLFAKKKKDYSAPVPPPSKKDQQSRADKFDAQVRKYMFTLSGVTKSLPDGSRTILKNINLSFYPGAKIGVVGLNGSGKSSLLKVMAGVDKSFDGVAVPMPGASVGYLAQEPVLEGATVIDNINMGVKKSQDLLDKFSELSVKCGEALSDEEMEKTMAQLAELQDKIDAGNVWEIDRVKQRAMDALRCPPPNAPVNVLSGGERRRVAIARLLVSYQSLPPPPPPHTYIYICTHIHATPNSFPNYVSNIRTH